MPVQRVVLPGAPRPASTGVYSLLEIQEHSPWEPSGQTVAAIYPLPFSSEDPDFVWVPPLCSQGGWPQPQGMNCDWLKSIAAASFSQEHTKRFWPVRKKEKKSTLGPFEKDCSDTPRER